MSALAPGERAVLATVVDVRGSSYRLPGAKMLILESGETRGTVSGGCLETDVMERAKSVLATGEAAVFTYDTAKNEDSVFSLNMGCRGIIRILLEPLENVRDSLLYKTLLLAAHNRERLLTGTLISGGGEFPAGGRFFHTGADRFSFEGFPESFRAALEDDCRRLFHENSPPIVKVYAAENGIYEVFFEIFAPPVNLLLFGAGNDAIPVTEIAKTLGWRVTVADHRPAFATNSRFPAADEIIAAPVADVAPKLFGDPRTAAVVMTHNYDRDREIVARLLKSDCFYIGVLGPKRRIGKLLDEIRERNKIYTIDQIARIHAPVGLDIGADTPESIALAIVAEIQAVIKNRRGGYLREREGSIYERGS